MANKLLEADPDDDTASRASRSSIAGGYTNIYDKLNDVSKYTGMYKQRFGVSFDKNRFGDRSFDVGSLSLKSED